MEDVRRLRQVPTGAELLPARHLADRVSPTTTQSRFINERAHANIQKDGTYSVVPQDVGRRHLAPTSCAPSPTWSTSIAIPTVKVTGGQRIDLLGVRKEDLPGGLGRLWASVGLGLGPRLRQGACAR